MMHSSLATAAVVLLLMSVSPALAQSPSPQAQPSMFSRLDQNRDGVVTREEYMRFREQMFQRLDANKDGQLAQNEWGEPRAGGPGMRGGSGPQAGSGAPAARPRVGMRIADANGDGAITRAEWDARSEALFAQRDRNKDGRLTPDEFGPMRQGIRR